MKHTGTKEEMYLAFDCLFNPNEDKCVELPALYADQEPLPGKLSLFLLLGSGSMSLEYQYISWAWNTTVWDFPQEFGIKEYDALHLHLSKKKAEQRGITCIRIMTDVITADTRRRIWFLSCETVPVLALDYLLSLQINAVSAEDVYKILTCV